MRMGVCFRACAAIVGAVAAAIGREPDYYAGKPDVTLLQDLADRGGFAPDEILVVGDSLESDITMANRYGSPSVHILSAEGLVQRHISYAADQQPYIVLKALHELPDLRSGLYRLNDSSSPDFGREPALSEVEWGGARAE